MWKDFKDFAFRGNVIDLAVAVVIGGAFGAIITSFVNDIITPFIGVLLGGRSVSDLAYQVGDATIAYGNFLQQCINFLIIAFSIFLVIRMGTKSGVLKKKEEPPAPVGPSETDLLTEIRDLLKEK